MSIEDEMLEEGCPQELIDKLKQFPHSVCPPSKVKVYYPRRFSGQMDYITGLKVPIDTTMTITQRRSPPIKLKKNKKFKMVFQTSGMDVQFDPPLEYMTQYGSRLSRKLSREYIEWAEQGYYCRLLRCTVWHSYMYPPCPQHVRYEMLRNCYLLVKLQRAVKAWLYGKRYSMRMRSVLDDIKYMPNGSLYMEAYDRSAHLLF